jgi:NADPH-dependent 2,4-dienoyl-CoA reductase/sulfur reductase-like enzyme
MNCERRRDGVVIVGGGLAGQRCAETLRRQGYDGPIRMVCAERHRPYDRPPLSKELLAGADVQRVPSYRPADWYREHTIDLLLGVSAVGLYPVERRVELSDGASLSYDWLLVATGSRPRTLRLLDGYENVSVLRTLDDSQHLRDVLAQRPNLLVIGAGFIGQEVAATARSLGISVTLVEAAPCPLVGVLGPQLGHWFSQLHTSEGVEVLTDCTIERVLANGAIQAMKLSNGKTVTADHVVVGVGVEPDIGWLGDSGLQSPAGVLADPHGRTAAERVLCAGDAAATFDPLAGRHLTGSHWEAAGRQGTRAARVMLGLDPGPAPLTSFWTDQYGIRIQYLGQARLADALEIDGEPDTRNFTAKFSRAGHVVAALLVDRPRSLPALRTLIEKGIPCPT